MAVFRGTLTEVLLHFVQHADLTRLEKARLLQEATSAPRQPTVNRWLRGTMFSVHKYATALSELLTQHGYEIIDRDTSSGAADKNERKSVINPKSLVIADAAHAVCRLIPIADFLLSDACSEEDRKKLHELAGPDSVLKLTTRLRRLCSETARRQLKDI
jgi:hypothetical protein